MVSMKLSSIVLLLSAFSILIAIIPNAMALENRNNSFVSQTDSCHNGKCTNTDCNKDHQCTTLTRNDTGSISSNPQVLNFLNNFFR